MLVYFLSFAAAAVLSAILTPLVRRFALAKNIVDAPGGRHIHQKPTARLGGAAIFLSFWLVVISYGLWVNRIQFVNETIAGIDKNLFGVFLGAMVLVVLGVFDDIRGVKPGWKLFWQFAAAALAVAFGVKIWWLNNPLGGPNIVLGNWTYLVVPLWIVLVINVVNWLDGLDGLAVGTSAIAAAILFFLSLAPFVNQPATALLAIILAGSTLGFLPYNFHPAKIFLGDAGSQFLGYMLAIFAIISGAKVATAALILGVPILDALWVIARRLLSGGSPFQADRLHFHHRLVDAGLSQRVAAAIYWVFSLTFGLIALQTQTRGKTTAALWLLILMFLTATIVVTKSQTQNRNIK